MPEVCRFCEQREASEGDAVVLTVKDLRGPAQSVHRPAMMTMEGFPSYQIKTVVPASFDVIYPSITMRIPRCNPCSEWHRVAGSEKLKLPPRPERVLLKRDPAPGITLGCLSSISLFIAAVVFRDKLPDFGCFTCFLPLVVWILLSLAFNYERPSTRRARFRAMLRQWRAARNSEIERAQLAFDRLRELRTLIGRDPRPVGNPMTYYHGEFDSPR